MAELIFGVDFGTTNSLASYVDPVSDRVVNLVNLSDRRPHPSVVWYRGGSVVVGRDARKWLDASEEAISGSFVRSPKRLLQAHGTVFVDGREVDPVDVIAEVLAHIKKDAVGPERQHAIPLGRAVLTIPVELDGEGRGRLRQAARKAGISVVQFVHEPLAALYGYLRSQPNYRQLIGELDGQRVLVFDWGGGTLDLTLCLVQGGRLLQVASRGNNDVGGDRFDDVIRNHVLDAHAIEHEIEEFEARETENAQALLVNACERAKIELSTREKAPVLVRNFLLSEPGQDLAVYLTRADVEDATKKLVERGLGEISKLLDSVGLNADDVAFCLPTGGMVNMPAIRDGLIQKFGSRVKRLPDGDRIISTGAALIAHDNLRLSLAKPIELLQPDNTYISLVEPGFELPLENQTVRITQRMFYCADPRDGVAHFQFARPRRLGFGSHRSERLPYLTAQLPVDPFARPFTERLQAEVVVDHDYVVTIQLQATGRNAMVEAKIYDLEFALDLVAAGGCSDAESAGETEEPNTAGEGIDEAANGEIFLRSNVTGNNDAWHLVPGDAMEALRPSYFVHGNAHPTARQLAERLYYHPCAVCRRDSFECQRDGCDRECSGVPSCVVAEERSQSLGLI